MTKKNLIYIILGFILTFAFLYLVYNVINQNQLTALQEITKIKPTDHIKWAQDKKNVLIEYSDFQCLACKAFHDYLKKEIEATDSGGLAIRKKVTFVFRHFPLYQIHISAFKSASTAEAAGRQGKFFEMVDLLYSHQDQWINSPNKQSVFINFAQQLKLDIEKFKKDLGSKEVQDKVNNDLQSGNDAGINSTPTLFLNGKKLEPTSFDQLKKLLLSL